MIWPNKASSSVMSSRIYYRKKANRLRKRRIEKRQKPLHSRAYSLDNGNLGRLKQRWWELLLCRVSNINRLFGIVQNHRKTTALILGPYNIWHRARMLHIALFHFQWQVMLNDEFRHDFDESELRDECWRNESTQLSLKRSFYIKMLRWMGSQRGRFRRGMKRRRSNRGPIEIECL